MRETGEHKGAAVAACPPSPPLAGSVARASNCQYVALCNQYPQYIQKYRLVVGGDMSQLQRDAELF